MRAVDAGIERRGRLVHQQHVGIGRQRPGDAQPLLLPAGQLQRRLVQPVLDFVPQRRPPQRLSRRFRRSAACPRTPATRGP